MGVCYSQAVCSVGLAPPQDYHFYMPVANTETSV